MSKKLKNFLSISLIFLVALFLLFYFFRENKPEEVDIDQMPIVSEVEADSNSFETYESKMGFSFQYPSQFFVMEDFEVGIPERLFVLVKKQLDEDPTGIIISTAKNNDNQTPLEWLEGSYSGADLSNEHGTLDLDGQEAIFLDGGTWIVAVTPDSKYRLIFAPLATSTVKNGDLLFLGMDTILSSFKFEE